MGGAGRGRAGQGEARIYCSEKLKAILIPNEGL